MAVQELDRKCLVLFWNYSCWVWFHRLEGFFCFVFPASHLEFLFLVLCGNSTVKKGSPQ